MSKSRSKIGGPASVVGYGGFTRLLDVSLVNTLRRWLVEPNLHTDADKYQTGMGRWSKTLAPLFIEFIEGIKEGDRVLDVGCGTGSLTFTIADRTKASTIVGIDPSVGYVEYARAQNSHPHVAFEIGDAQKPPYDNGSFDCCVSSLMIQLSRMRTRQQEK